MGGRNTAPVQSSQIAAGGNPRTVQVQSAQRQALIQQAKDRIAQNNGAAANTEAERKRRIQVSLRRRSQGG